MIIPNGMQTRVVWDPRYGKRTAEAQKAVMETVRRLSFYMDHHDKKYHVFDNGYVRIHIERVAGIQNVWVASHTPILAPAIAETYLLAFNTTASRWDKYSLGGSVLKTSALAGYMGVVGNSATKVYHAVSSGSCYVGVSEYTPGLTLDRTFNVDLWVPPFSTYFSGYGFSRANVATELGCMTFDSADRMYLTIDMEAGTSPRRYINGFVVVNITSGAIENYYSHDYNQGPLQNPDVIRSISIRNSRVYMADSVDVTLAGCVRTLSESNFALISVQPIGWQVDTVRATADGLYVVYTTADPHIHLALYNSVWGTLFDMTISGRQTLPQQSALGAKTWFLASYSSTPVYYSEIYRYGKSSVAKLADTAEKQLLNLAVIEF